MQNLPEKYPEISAAIELSLYEDFAENLDEFGCFEPESVESICSQSYDGFMPYTNGGYRAMVMQTLDMYYSAYGREAEIIQPYIDSSENDAAAEFVNARGQDAEPDTLGQVLAEAYEAADLPKYGGDGSANFVYNWFNDREQEYIDLAALYPDGDLLGDKPAQFYNSPAGILQEEFHEFSTEYMQEGGEYWLVANANYFAADNHRNETGQDEVFFFAGVNTDFTYGRDKGLESTWEKTYKLKYLTPDRVRVIIQAMQASISATNK